MMRKLIFIILCLVLFPSFISAESFWDRGLHSFDTIYCLLTGCEIDGNLNVTGNITADYFIGDGSLLNNIQDNDTTYTAGSNLTLTGTTFSWNSFWSETVFAKISDLVSYVGNWSADKPNYSTTVQADLLYSDITEPIASSLGNWSADSVNYYTSIQTDSQISDAAYWNISGTSLYTKDLDYNLGIGTNETDSKLTVLGNITLGPKYGTVDGPTELRPNKMQMYSDTDNVVIETLISDIPFKLITYTPDGTHVQCYVNNSLAFTCEEI